jgi:hypothetical protein
MVKKNVFTGLIMLSLMMISSSLTAQGKYFTRNGFISFFSSTPAEEIKAVNENVSCVLDAETGKVEFAALMTAFQFKKALMAEHFNENYVESALYPKAVFSGVINNFNAVDMSKPGSYPVIVSGNMTMHGVTKEFSTEGTVEIKDGNLFVSTEFNIVPEDYKIEIPGVVREKIAKELLVTVKAKMEPLD